MLPPPTSDHTSPILSFKLEIPRLQILKHPIWIILPTNLQQPPLILLSIPLKDILSPTRVVPLKMNRFSRPILLAISFAREMTRAAAEMIRSSSASSDHIMATFIRFKGPSVSSTPRAFPPFLRKSRIIGEVIGCMTKAGAVPAASLMVSISWTKMSRIWT